MSYIPRPSQKKFHNNRAQFRAMVGGLGSGKTTMGAREALRLSQSFPGSLGCIGRLTATALRDTTQRRFFEILDEVTDGHRDRLIHRWVEARGHLVLKTPVKGLYSEILFKHLDEPGPLGSLDLDWWWIDECHEPDGGEVPEEVFLMLRARLRGKVGPLRGVITSNSGGKDWIWKWFFSKQRPRGFWGIVVSSWENRDNLPPNYIEDLIRDHPEEWVKRFIECSFDVFQGQIFEEFDTREFVIDDSQIPDSAKTLDAGLDYGVSAPTAVIAARIAPDGTVYCFDEFHRPDADIREVAEWFKSKNLTVSWADPTVRNKTSVSGGLKKSPRDLYADEGITLMPAPSNDALMRIMTIHQYLRRRKIYFSKRCEVTIACLEQSQWKVVKPGERERPAKKEDHPRDALAYLLLSRPLGNTLSPVDPRSKPGGLIVPDGSGGWRHKSLDEDTDKQSSQAILTEDEFLKLVGG